MIGGEQQVEATKKPLIVDREKLSVVRKRDGSDAIFDKRRIFKAIEKAFRAEREIGEHDPLEGELHEELEKITNDVVEQVTAKFADGTIVEVEQIQDTVEMQLMAYGHYKIARRYIVYREDRAKARRLARGTTTEESGPQLSYTRADGSHAELEWEAIRNQITTACEPFSTTSANLVINDVSSSLYDGIPEDEVETALILAARTRIEREPEYAKVAAQLLLNVIYKQVFGATPEKEMLEDVYRTRFESYLELGVREGRLDKELLSFNLEKLAEAIKPERDDDFLYMGLQTVYDRYLLHVDGRRIETPQYFWMRVAMGLSVGEAGQREERAIEFYNVLSTFRFVSSTPTLFNSGTLHPQLSSCYLSTIKDDLSHIFKVISDNAQLSKWAGGIGNDWTNVRATGAHIQGTNGQSQGIVPFLKVANDTAVAVNQGGKRKGAMCAYLESWHLEIEEFLELRKNTGDDRRRTHDMNTANWIPDLFMKRVQENGVWTLFSPDHCPDLHDLYGKEFEKRYEEYERMTETGEIKLFKRIPATELWRKMLSMLFETGHPWMTFKDPSNIRSPQDHKGVVHSSNLCTEILLNTSPEETAVCNLGSINLVKHVTPDGLNEELLKDTIRTAVRMLDNVIDINYYPTNEARNSNLRHRPVGMGLMGFQDALYILGLSYDSEGAVEFADKSMETISYYGILTSTELAKERGKYESYEGSKWDRGMLPIDTIDLLSEQRGAEFLKQDRTTTFNWDTVRDAVKQHGMRNSNVMAIAPTATIANISGVSQSIEPTFRNLYVKSNLSGEFTVVNAYLVEDLKKLDLWDDEMLDDLKYFDGSVQQIERIPQELKERYRTAIEIDSKFLIDAASRRQKWIDMGQSLNLYIGEPSGKALSDMYMHARESGLKTTYDLRSVAATQIEKSSVDINRRGLQPRWMKNKSASSEVGVERKAAEAEKAAEKPTKTAQVCDMSDPDCEACQ